MQPTGFSTRLPEKWRFWILLLGLSVGAVLGFLGRMDSGLPVQWNYQFLDAYLKYSASGKAAHDAVVVDIDDISLSAAGQWPWPRYRIAALIQAVADAEPAAIGLDILFSEPDRTSLKNIQSSFKRDFGLNLTFLGAPPGLSDNDGYLGQVLSGSGTDVVGAFYFYFDHSGKEGTLAPPAFHISGRTDLLSLNDAPGVLGNIDEIAAGLKFSGFINSQPDRDGMLRRMPLLIQYQGALYPHISLATFMRSLGVDSARIEADRNGPVIHVGSHRIPIDKKGFALLRFNGGSYLYNAVSAVDVLNGASQKAGLKDKIVFVGSSAAALNDLHSTIFDSQFPGLKMQAVTVDNMANDDFVREPSWSDTAVLLASIAMGLLVSGLFIVLRSPIQLILGSLTLAVLAFLGFAYLIHSASIFISPLMPMMVIAVLFALFTTTRFAIEKRQAYAWFKMLANARQLVMESMAAVAETRHPETGAHIKRTQNYVRAVAEKLRSDCHYTEILTPEFIDLLFVSAPLHDIGKVGIPDNILLKSDSLTPPEFELMKKHAEYGRNIICSAAQRIEGDNFLSLAGEIAFTHHEMWDGSGYPQGLAGQEIPLSGRIMIVADVYDALVNRRCYKDAFAHEYSIELMRKSRATMFDPVIFDAFLSIERNIREIALTYQDLEKSGPVLGDR